MAQTRISHYLTVASNVAILVSATLIVAATLSPRSAKDPNRRIPAPGDRIPAVENLRFSDSNVTSLLFVRSDCHYCTDSMPFYRELVGRSHSSGKRRRVVVVTMEEPDKIAKYLDANGLAVDAAVSARFADFGVSSTPSLIVVDRYGKAVIGRVGRLSTRAEKEVLESIDKL